MLRNDDVLVGAAMAGSLGQRQATASGIASPSPLLVDRRRPGVVDANDCTMRAPPNEKRMSRRRLTFVARYSHFSRSAVLTLKRYTEPSFAEEGTTTQ